MTRERANYLFIIHYLKPPGTVKVIRYQITDARTPEEWFISTMKNLELWTRGEMQEWHPIKWVAARDYRRPSWSNQRIPRYERQRLPWREQFRKHLQHVLSNHKTDPP